jgi:hypothetical protein
LVVLDGSSTRRVTRSRLPGRTQRLEECHDGGCFRRTQILAVRGHISSTLDNLTNELIRSSPHGYIIEGRSPLPADLIQRMTIAALLTLKYERTLPL